MDRVIIANKTCSLRQPVVAAWCDSFASRLKGLMFTASLQPQAGIVLVQPGEDVLNAAIHMLFMNYDIAVIWASRERRVVDTACARKWRLAYAPSKPAQYVLELHPSRLDEFHIGDQLVFEKCAD